MRNSRWRFFFFVHITKEILQRNILMCIIRPYLKWNVWNISGQYDPFNNFTKIRKEILHFSAPWKWKIYLFSHFHMMEMGYYKFSYYFKLIGSENNLKQKCDQSLFSLLHILTLLPTRGSLLTIYINTVYSANRSIYDIQDICDFGYPVLVMRGS